MSTETERLFGIPFWSQRYSQNQLLITIGGWRGWFFYKHPDGQWVSFRKASEDDLLDLLHAVASQTPPIQLISSNP